MNKILTIMKKEISDNLRDRRSLFFAFVYGPILMPALMIGPVIFQANKHFQNYETPTHIHVYGEGRAPNLIKYLKGKNIDVQTVSENFEDKLVQGEVDIVLEISETYGERFIEGAPARVIVHYDKENNDSQRIFWKLRGDLEVYAQTIAAYRMMIRGLDQQLLRSIDIVENDLSKEDVKAGFIANITMFLAVFSMMMGGMYLAVDTTAGERERMSLEPLLSLAVTRFQVAMGKYLAILAFVFVSFLLPIISVAILTHFIPDDFFGNADIPTILTFIKITVIALPLCLLMTGFLMAISAFSKSTKEAQTQMGFAMLVPMTPFILAQFMNIKLDLFTSLMPILSQYLIAGKIVMDSGFALSSMLPGAAATLVLAAVLFGIAVQLYRQDSILG